MTDWTPLTEEFAIWRDLDLTLPLWWRDDDAIQPTPALDRLEQLARDVQIPVHLAVIPDHLHPELGAYIQNAPQLRAITHGWTHRNLALPPRKSCEFGRGRATAEVAPEITEGAALLQRHFGAKARAVFAPPWNRFFLDHAPLLARAGYAALSLYKPRIWRMAAPGVELINTHVDPIDWRGTRALLPPEQIIARTAKLMRDRRMGYTDPAEPLGFLTHHLVHGDAIWHFSAEFLNVMRAGPVILARMPRFSAQKDTAP